MRAKLFHKTECWWNTLYHSYPWKDGPSYSGWQTSEKEAIAYNIAETEKSVAKRTLMSVCQTQFTVIWQISVNHGYILIL